MQPYEVSYTRSGRKGVQRREVIGVLTPTPLALYLGAASPKFESLGDVEVDWKAPQSPGYIAMFEAGESE